MPETSNQARASPRLQLLLAEFARTPWAILETSLEQYRRILIEHTTSDLPDEEIRARLEGRQYGAQRESNLTEFMLERSPHTALIPLYGPILNRFSSSFLRVSGVTSPQVFARLVREAADNPAITEILIDVDSPGGTVAGTSEAADAVAFASTQKRVTAIANELMASAAYWISSQATRVVATPNAIVGSIGVIFAHEDWTEFWAGMGVQLEMLRTAPLKALGGPDEKLTDLARETIMEELLAFHDKFAAAVAEGRGRATGRTLSAEDVPTSGDTFTSEQALELGLIDEIASYRETLIDITTSIGLDTARRVNASILPSGWEVLELDATTTIQVKENSMDRPTLEGLTPEQEAYIQSLEQQLEATTREAEPASLEAVVAELDIPDDVKARITENEREAKEARAIAEAERNIRLDREYRDRASAFDRLGVSADELGSLLRAAHEGEPFTPEQAELLERVLASTNERLVQADVFTTAGRDGGGENTARARLFAKAEDLIAKEAGLSMTDAIARVAEANPDLYKAYQDEQSSRAS